MIDPKRRESDFNAASRDQWDGFSEHRRRVSALLAAGQGRLCVLGAGNANDLDLPRLLDAYREVHLVDLDAGALAGGTERQGVAGRPGLRMHGGVDVTGMVDAIGRWSPMAEIPATELRALVEWPSSRVGLALPGPFDVVASTCLLSPIVGNAFLALGDRHHQFAEVVRAIRLGHLRLLTRLAGPGRMVLLVTDVTSTNWVPDLGSIEESALPGLIAKMGRERRLINGVDPAEIVADLRSDPAVGGLEILRPWRWRLHTRTYAVWAIRMAVGPPNRLPPPLWK